MGNIQKEKQQLPINSIKTSHNNQNASRDLYLKEFNSQIDEIQSYGKKVIHNFIRTIQQQFQTVQSAIKEQDPLAVEKIAIKHRRIIKDILEYDRTIQSLHQIEQKMEEQFDVERKRNIEGLLAIKQKHTLPEKQLQKAKGNHKRKSRFCLSRRQKITKEIDDEQVNTTEIQEQPYKLEKMKRRHFESLIPLLECEQVYVKFHKNCMQFKSSITEQVKCGC